MFLGRSSIARLVNCISKTNFFAPLSRSIRNVSTVTNDSANLTMDKEKAISKKIPIAEMVKDGEQAFAEFEGSITEKDYLNLNYEVILERIQEARLFEKAYEVIVGLRNLGIKPSEKAYNSAVASGYKTLKLNELRELFGTKLVPFQKTFTKDPIHSPFFEKILQLKSWMMEDKLRFTPVFYDEMATYLNLMNYAGIMINIATTLEEQGVEPSIKFYNEMISCLPKAGLLVRADAIFDRLVALNKTNEETFLNRLASFGKSYHTEDIESFFAEYLKRYPNANIRSYNIYIKTLLRMNNLEKAFECFEEMQTTSDKKPDQYTINHLMGYMVRTNDLSCFEKVIEYGKTISYPSDTLDFCLLLRVYSRTNLPKALQLALQIPKPYDQQIYLTALNIFTDNLMSTEVKNELYHVMFLHNNIGKELVPQQGDIAELFADHPMTIRSTIAHMEAEKLPLNPPIYDSLMRAAIRRRSLGVIETLMERMNKDRITQLNSHYNFYLTALLLQDKQSLAINILGKMNAKKMNISNRNRLLLEERNIPIDRSSSPPSPSNQFTENNNKPFERRTDEDEDDSDLFK